MGGTIVIGIVLAFVLAVVVAGAAIAVVAVVRVWRRRNSSVEERGRRAIMNLAMDRGRRHAWAAGSVGIIGAGSGTGCGGGGGSCAGAGCGGGCGGGGCGG